jgi:hypothetical protein
MALSISALLRAEQSAQRRVAAGMQYHYGKDEFCGAYAYNPLTSLNEF